MTDINELLDELDRAHDRVYMSNATGQHLPGKLPNDARRAVDAEVKRMQDRIAELEAGIRIRDQRTLLNYRLKDRPRITDMDDIIPPHLD